MIEKRRTNLSKESYIVMEKSGTNYLIRAKDFSVDYYPGYKLLKCSNSIPFGKKICEFRSSKEFFLFYR